MSANPLGKFSLKLDNYSHIGWIPCIAGRLNYNNASSVKALDSKKAARGINARINANSEGDGGSRILAVTSTYDWADDQRNILANSSSYTEDEDLNEHYKKEDFSGEFKIMALGRAEKFDDHCVFKLRVGIVSTEYKSTFDTTEDLFDKLREKKKSDRDGMTRAEVFKELHASLDVSDTDLSRNMDKGYFVVEALLHPNGLILCKYIDGPEIASFREGRKLFDQRNTIVRQAYYYLKYIFHHHKHHHEPDDCACTVIPIPKDHQAIGQKLVGNLTSGVNQFRRMLDSLGRCSVDHMGVIGYIESLAKSCKRVGLYTDDAYEHQVERLRYIKRSFSAMVAARSIHRMTFNQLLTVSLQITTLLVLILGTYCVLSGEPGGKYAAVAGFILGIVVVGMLVMHFVIKKIKTYGSKLFSLSKWQSRIIASVLLVAVIGASVWFYKSWNDFFEDSAQASTSVVQAVETSLGLELVNKHHSAVPVSTEVPVD